MYVSWCFLVCTVHPSTWTLWVLSTRGILSQVYQWRCQLRWPKVRLSSWEIQGFTSFQVTSYTYNSGARMVILHVPVKIGNLRKLLSWVRRNQCVSYVNGFEGVEYSRRKIEHEQKDTWQSAKNASLHTNSTVTHVWGTWEKQRQRGMGRKAVCMRHG